MAKFVLRFRTADRRIFNALKSGDKTIETRAATPRFAKIKPGDELILICGQKRLTRPVSRVEHFESLEKMLGQIPYTKIMPWVSSREEAIKVYYSFPRYPEKIKQFGILALS